MGEKVLPSVRGGGEEEADEETSHSISHLSIPGEVVSGLHVIHQSGSEGFSIRLSGLS